MHDLRKPMHRTPAKSTRRGRLIRSDAILDAGTECHPTTFQPLDRVDQRPNPSLIMQEPSTRLLRCSAFCFSLLVTSMKILFFYSTYILCLPHPSIRGAVTTPVRRRDVSPALFSPFDSARCSHRASRLTSRMLLVPLPKPTFFVQAAHCGSAAPESPFLSLKMGPESYFCTRDVLSYRRAALSALSLFSLSLLFFSLHCASLSLAPSSTSLPQHQQVFD